MEEIRLQWRNDVPHVSYEIEQHGEWIPSSPDARIDLELIALTANNLYGPRTHWIESRVVRRPGRESNIKFSDRVLHGDAAASPYARQLTSGFANLRFSDAVEAEYSQYLNSSQRQSALWCAFSAAVIWFFFAIFDPFRLPSSLGNSMNVMEVMAIILGRWGILALLCYSVYLLQPHKSEPSAAKISAAVFFPMAAFASLSANIYKLHGIADFEIALLLIIFAVFFPLGLRFYQSLTIGASVTAASVALSLLLQPASAYPDVLRFSGILVLTAGLAAVSGYLREYSHREQFLLRSLLAKQAYIDPLTGLYNRRWTDHMMLTAQRQATRDEKPMCFIMMDIDYFKPYNDCYGHPAGDQALKTVADVISSFAQRPLDVASRLGGEEFGLLLYDCDLTKAQNCAEDIRAKLQAIGIRHEASPISNTLTISMGIVESQPNETVMDLYKRADKLLYVSKKEGRAMADTPSN